MLSSRAGHNWCANMTVMAVNNGSTPATHFGRQMRKERLARGWSLREFSARTGINIGSASQIENGKRPPTEAVAARCDEAFPERKGWFTEYYEESKSWLPPGLRSWAEHEDKAVRLEVWSPGIVHGLFQTEDYARVFIAALPGALPLCGVGTDHGRSDGPSRRDGLDAERHDAGAPGRRASGDGKRADHRRQQRGVRRAPGRRRRLHGGRYCCAA